MGKNPAFFDLESGGNFYTFYFSLCSCRKLHLYYCCCWCNCCQPKLRGEEISSGKSLSLSFKVAERVLPSSASVAFTLYHTYCSSPSLLLLPSLSTYVQKVLFWIEVFSRSVFHQNFFCKMKKNLFYLIFPGKVRALERARSIAIIAAPYFYFYAQKHDVVEQSRLLY